MTCSVSSQKDGRESFQESGYDMNDLHFRRSFSHGIIG